MLVFDLLSLSCVWEGVFPLERHNHVHNIGLGFGLIEDDEVWLKDATYHPAPSVRGTACLLLGELLWQPGYCGVLGLAGSRILLIWTELPPVRLGCVLQRGYIHLIG